MDPFFTRLRDYWESVGKALRREAEVASVFPNTADIGVSRERLYIEFLRAHVPAFCTVSLGGFAFGADGSESRQIDVLVASGSSLRFDFLNKDRQGKSFACVDGLVAAVSLKSNLDGKEIADAVENLASLPLVAPIGGLYHPMGPRLKDYDAWPLKVIYAPDGAMHETALEHLRCVTAALPVTRWPDLVHVCGKYVVVKIGADGARTRDGTTLQPNSFFAQTTRPDAWGFAMVTQRIQEIEQSMRMMLFTYDYLLDKFPT
ncbi:MAG TPA: DUF6602 domain-containing protein [Candidatus Methylomirabilis sp.]|nr:DUF6602 domain-containing protein [Candidatus Methylomirabilis sp.]